MSEPEPTEVRPTTMPPRMPMSSVGSALDHERELAVAGRRRGEQRADDEADRDDEQRDAERQLHARAGAPAPDAELLAGAARR